VGDHPEADAAALADPDRAGDLLQPLPGLLLDPALDVGDQLLGLVVAAQPERPVDDQVDRPGISSSMAELMAAYSPPMPAPVKNRQA
jgi:hypothetical protein